MLLQLSHFFSLCPPLPSTPLPSSNPIPWFMSLGRACKFFGVSISYVILNISLSILYLPIMLFNPCTFSLILRSPLPINNSPNDLHTYDSIPVLVVCLVSLFVICLVLGGYFWFWGVFLDSVVDSSEFVAFLMFVVLIFFFLNESF